MRGASTRRIAAITHIPTRTEFAEMDMSDIEWGMSVRSGEFEKWRIVDPSTRNLEGVEKLLRAHFATTPEKSLPKQFLIVRCKKPAWFVEEIH